MSAHAKYSCSGSKQLLLCPGSNYMQRVYTDRSSEFAAEGTAAHQLAAECYLVGGKAAARIGEKIDADGFTFTVDDDMAMHVQSYLDFIDERKAAYELAGASVQVLIEQRVDVSHLVGMPDTFGTADCVIIAIFADGRVVVEVIDLKYGRGVPVSAIENSQLALYASGVVSNVELSHEVSEVVLVICQPRMGQPSEWPTDTSYLRNLCASYADHIQLSEQIYEGKVAVTDHLNPVEDACRFCRAKAICPALEAKVQAEVGAEFDDLTAVFGDKGQDLPDMIGLNTEKRLSRAMKCVGLIEDWCKAIRAEVERRLLDGIDIEGFKLVRGRQGPRKWDDEAAVEATLKSMRLKIEDMYDLKLISPTTAEKLVKREVIGPRQWKTLQESIKRSEAGLSVAPIADPRPAENPVAGADEFDLVG